MYREQKGGNYGLYFYIALIKGGVEEGKSLEKEFSLGTKQFFNIVKII